MGGKVLRSFNTLDNNEVLISAINFSCQPCTGYFKVNEKWEPLQLKSVGDSGHTVLAIEGPGTWDAEKYDFELRQKIKISNPSKLFGREGIAAYTGAQLGIAAVWSSSKAQIRGCTKLAVFSSEEAKAMPSLETELKLTFQAGNLCGSLEAEYIIYLVRPGRPSMCGMASMPGTKLGTLGGAVTILIDGEGSMFPISTVYEPGAPLWWMDFSIVDPLTDEFSEHYINLILNTAHSDFKELGKDQGYNTALYREVLQSAIEMLVLKIYTDFSEEMKTVSLSNAEPGSIAAAIKYMEDTFGIDTSSSETVHSSLRKGLYPKLK